jgi:hypothetical protein
LGCSNSTRGWETNPFPPVFFSFVSHIYLLTQSLSS